jgi:hypothetical protein
MTQSYMSHLFLRSLQLIGQCSLQGDLISERFELKRFGWSQFLKLESTKNLKLTAPSKLKSFGKDSYLFEINTQSQSFVNT